MNFKDIKQKPNVLLLLTFLVVLFSACTMDDPMTVIPAKSQADYVTQMTEFMAKEKLAVDSTKVGYNKLNFKTKTDSTNVKATYLAVLVAAQAIVTKADVKISEIVAADKSLSIPGKAFWAALFISDRRALNDSIIAATALNTATLQGNLAGQVLLDAKTAFSAVITAASSTRSATASVDLQIQTAIKNVTAAKKTFQLAIIPTTIEAYVDRSKTYVGAQKAMVEASVAGFNIGEYSVSLRTNYLNALIAAETAINASGVDHDKVSVALTALNTPRTAFKSFVSDRRPLNDSIVVAEGLNQAVVGTATGNVSQTAKTTFTTAIATAKTTRDLVTATDGVVKASAYKLGEAIKTFRLAIVK
jgi:hypothetical protein